MQPLLAATTPSWPEAAIFITMLLVGAMLLAGGVSAFLDMRRVRMKAGQDEEVRQLVGRYEHLASSTHDAQQRTATDIAELRTRVTSIEQILRSVD